ncbi:MAG: hypothetical protein KatS3mg057_0982 [Herpetosiphonaceae bacterium]|nr:MAG: hypothetical protein KatS3mg057_0982 [Herpetosiphonaceae bacterium]
MSAGDRQRIENGLRDLQAEIERLLLVHDTLIESDEERATLEKMRSLWDEFVDLTHQKFLSAAEISEYRISQPCLWPAGAPISGADLGPHKSCCSISSSRH